MSSSTTPPTPPNERDQERVAEQGRRRSILEGTWEPLLRAHLTAQLGAERSAMVGMPDTSSNLAKQIVTQVATLYDSEPVIDGPDKAGVDALREQLAKAHVWTLAQRNQRLTLMVNESLVFLGWCPPVGSRDGRLTAEVVPADLVFAEPGPEPGQPGALYRARRRPKGGGGSEEVWTWDVWDIREPDPDADPRSPAALRPSFRVLSEDTRTDLTMDYVDPEEWRGASYPYRLADGTPVMPAVLYHAEPHGSLWDVFSNAETVFGTLQDALNWTNTNHAFMRASWAQRYIGGGSIRGTVSKTADGETVAVAREDPATATQIRSDGDGSLTIGQWGASVDIDKAERFARNYGARLAVHFGLSPADISIDRVNATSGASLTVSREGLRSVRKRYAPMFRESDVLLLERASAILRANGINVPAEGFTVEYAAVELSPEEKRTRLDNLRSELEMGLVTKVEAIMELNPGISEAEAKKRLAEVAKEIEAEKPPPPEPIPAPPTQQGAMDGPPPPGAPPQPPGAAPGAPGAPSA